MSARRHIISALSEDSLGGIATLSDVAHAEQLVDAHRAEVQRADAARIEDAACDADFTEDPKFIAGLRTAAELLTRAAGEQGSQESEVITVSRFDTAMEPAPDEDPLFAIGAIDEDGRPVALLFDEETRRKVAGWLAPDESGEKSSPTGAEATPKTTRTALKWPDDWDQVLNSAIREWGGEWNPQRVQRLYLARYGRGLYRCDARRFLSERAHAGFLTLHERRGARFYTFKTRKDGRS
ncbi:hypothetical protein ACH40E_33315 [Streptomyces acidicola]|uniref:hypothetical protein n=1 Tax=Streptomyces acidicola TaxID=2596892 RepID=UPI0037ABFD8D